MTASLKSPKTKELDFAIYLVKAAFRGLPKSALITGMDIKYELLPTKKSARKRKKSV